MMQTTVRIMTMKSVSWKSNSFRSEGGGGLGSELKP
jgi:hypothetical protein